jgi:hypothetical protein
MFLKVLEEAVRVRFGSGTPNLLLESERGI